MDNKELFQIIGQLYVDLHSAQRILQQLQSTIQEKEQGLAQQKVQINALEQEIQGFKSNESVSS